MNIKVEQISQKGTKDLKNKNVTGPVTGNFIDKIFTNMKAVKTHVKKARQQNDTPKKNINANNATSSVSPVHSNLEPEYLNNIFVDLQDTNKFTSKISKVMKSADETTNPRDVKKKSVNDDTNTNQIEKRQKTGIKRKLKKLMECKKQILEDDNKLKNTQADQRHINKFRKVQECTINIHALSDKIPKNVQQIPSPEKQISNNTSTSLAEFNTDTKGKKTKKDSKKKETKEKTHSKKIEHSLTLQENDKKTIKHKHKPKSKQKSVTNMSGQQSIKTQKSIKSQQSNKIQLIVNQIASNLKQNSCYELETGNIKRDIYIKGLSTCMTNQALEQINRILNPPHFAINRVHSDKHYIVSKPKPKQSIDTDVEPKQVSLQKLKMQSKVSLTSKISTITKLPLPKVDNGIIIKTKEVLQKEKDLKEKEFKEMEFKEMEFKEKVYKEKVYKEKVYKEKDQKGKEQTEKEPTSDTEENPTEILLSGIFDSTLDCDQDLIKKINEKIDKIIVKGLNTFENLDTSSVSIVDNILDDLPKRTPETEKKPSPVKIKELPRFIQVTNSKLSNTTTKKPVSPKLPTSEMKLNESLPHITNILSAVKNSELILDNIKQSTMTVLQKVKAVQPLKRPVSAIDKTKNTERIEKSNNNEAKKSLNVIQETPEKNLTETVIKTSHLSKLIQSSNDNVKNATLTKNVVPKIVQSNITEKTDIPRSAVNIIKKSSKHTEQNSSPPNTATLITKSNSLTIGSKSQIVTSSYLAKNNACPVPINANNNRLTNSTSTLNLIAALSASRKFGLISPMEVVQDFVNLVNHAKRNRKTYTICGNFYSLRRAFAERGWVEKMRMNVMEDKETWRKIENLSNFELVDGMRNKDYGEKYRRVFLTKLLAGHQVDFYWDYLTNPFAVNNDKIKRTLINRFPFGATRAYTSKHGLTESLKDAHWYCIDGYANVFYPRTYNLSMIEEVASFVEDFRITAVISLLLWIISNITTPENIISPSGDIPTSVYNFATIQCHNYIKIKEHRDIDEVVSQAKDYEWEVFLEKYYKIVHNDNSFKLNERISAELMIEQSKYVLKKIKKYLPNLHLDGFKNMWLLKPNNGSRGSGIHVCRTLKYMMDTVNNRKDVKYVVQKYLERPLLIHKTKFDIRQWFLVTCMPSVKVWLYKENYLRFSSQMFDLSKLHESIHLTNNSVQCKYKNNNQRSSCLPEQNMWDSEQFKKYLIEIGQPYAWRNIIYKGIKECLIGLFMLCQSKMELRINSFELCGADFMLTEDYKPYLIEINSRPALYASTKITARMCPKVLEDVIKVTVDHARNPKASTGDFELIYSDSFNYTIPRNVNNLYIEGMSYFTKIIDQTPSLELNTLISIPEVKEVNNYSIKKILNIDPGVVKIDVRNTLEKILSVVHDDSATDRNSPPEERNIQFRSMLTEFVNIISNVKNTNDEV